MSGVQEGKCGKATVIYVQLRQLPSYESFQELPHWAPCGPPAMHKLSAL